MENRKLSEACVVMGVLLTMKGENSLSQGMDVGKVKAKGRFR